jgi:hypothetical protein
MTSIVFIVSGDGSCSLIAGRTAKGRNGRKGAQWVFVETTHLCVEVSAKFQSFA